MSDGLRLISSILATGSGGALSSIERECLIDQELTVWDYVKSHYRRYRDLPTLQTVQTETGIRLPAANDSLQYYVDQVSSRHEYNLIRERFGSLRESLTDANMEVVSENIGYMHRVLNRRRNGPGRPGELVNMTDAGRMVTERLARIAGTGGVSGVTTGWPSYDNITGGYQDGDLITLVGRMGVGKTYVLLRMAQKAHEDGHNVLFVTTEMSIEPIARRYAALKTGVNPRLLKNGTISTYMMRRIAAMYNELAGADRLKIFAVGMSAKVDSIFNLIQEVGPSIVFIDGVYLLRPTDLARNASRADRVTAVYDELRAITLAINSPIVVSTQFNRASGKGGKDGTLETIGYSDAIGTHSSLVAAAKFGPTENPKDSRILEFLKGREGEDGEVVINFKFAPFNMDEMTTEEREDEGDMSVQSVEWMGGRRNPQIAEAS